MPAVKKAKKKAAKPLVPAADGSPCDQGTEILQEVVVVRPQERLEVIFTVCGTPAMGVVFMGGIRVFEQRIVNTIAVPVTAPSFGDVLLVAAIAPLATPWKAKVEVAVGGAVVFRHKKNSASSFPIPKWGLFIRVQA